MTPNPRTLPSTATVADAARTMRDEDVGAVLDVDRNQLRGIVTDRDIAVRVVAEGKDPQAMTLDAMCTGDVITIAPDDSVDDALRVMSEHAVRRVPVVENGKPVGIVSIGDLAVDRDRESVLADISAAPPNR
jgi:CBS domain-containing protein